MRLAVCATTFFVLAAAAPARAQTGDRPDARELRTSEEAVLARFTPEVRRDLVLRERALALWRARFAQRAAALERRFLREADWRPAFADAAALVDDFLDASGLPREGRWRADRDHDWVEALDPKTGQRVRQLRDAKRSPPLIAPEVREPELRGAAAPAARKPRTRKQPAP